MMPRIHKTLTYISIVILLICCTVSYFPHYWENLGIFLMSGFMLVEVGILETQRRENEAVVYYHKSCLLGLLDLAVAMVFIYIIGATIWDFFTSLSQYHFYYGFVFFYVAVRKLYIIKNYYYEK